MIFKDASIFENKFQTKKSPGKNLSCNVNNEGFINYNGFKPIATRCIEPTALVSSQSLEP